MKTVKVLSFAMVVVGCLATGRSLFAHHGDAAYSTEVIELKGAVVTGYSWMNPHSLIKVRGTDAKGQTREWTLEMGSTPSMELLGFSRSTDEAWGRDRCVAIPHQERHSGRAHEQDPFRRWNAAGRYGSHRASPGTGGLQGVASKESARGFRPCRPRIGSGVTGASPSPARS